MGFLILPFGFSGSHGLFQVTTDDVEAIHAATWSSYPSIDGARAFHCHIFADGGIFVEPRLGRRQIEAVECWDRAAQRILGNDAISEVGKREEGGRSPRNCILGFDIDNENIAIFPPPAKIEAARILVQIDALVPNNLIVRVLDFERLRGLVQYWTRTNFFWETTIHPIDMLMAWRMQTRRGYVSPSHRWIYGKVFGICVLC